MKSIPILLATHEYKFHIINSSTVDMLSSIKDKDFKFLEEKFICYDFKEIDKPINNYADFLKNSGLFDLISNRKIKNLVDYAIGIEVGLDSNSRKNRSGKIMEDLVEEFIKKLGTNLCAIGKATKKFDFVFKSPSNNELIVMEVNFYGTQGSKPNETAKSYVELNNEINKLNGVKFVWITDGNGWNKSRLNLEDAYDKIEHLYTIKDLELGVLEKI